MPTKKPNVAGALLERPTRFGPATSASPLFWGKAKSLIRLNLGSSLSTDATPIYFAGSISCEVLCWSIHMLLGGVKSRTESYRGIYPSREMLSHLKATVGLFTRQTSYEEAVRFLL
jgi:hypothetical protein